jgi:hypothetical protein
VSAAGRAGLALRTAAAAALVTGPTALAFFTGGYFDQARAAAGLVAWILVAVALVSVPCPLPRGRPAWLALGALGLLAAWTLGSIAWAPIAGGAYHAGEIVVLYLGALLAGAILLRPRVVRLAVEPALALGASMVIGYGISERLLPGVLHFARSVSAQGRLEQPLTYWNAMGELAALGLVLCARLVGDGGRPRLLRAFAAAASALLGMGLYLSFSRGALFACAAGLLALVVAAPRRAQVGGLGVAVAAAGLAAAAAAPFAGVSGLRGALAAREAEGAVALVLLVAIGAAAAAAAWRASAADGRVIRLPRRAPRLALAAICAGLAIAIVAGAKEGTSRPLGAGAGRLVTLQSNRYAYWQVALRAFIAQPLHGVGAGGWAVWWLRYRTVDEFATDAHSLPLQTLAELGVVGLLLLGAFAAGLAAAARTAHRVDPRLAAGPIAALVAYAAHAPLDWDWQMPAVTLVAIVLGGALLAQAAPRLTAPRRSAGPPG